MLFNFYIKYIALILIAVTFFTEVLPGQVLPFRRYTVRDGLISNSSNCLYQDSRGYLWVGTRDGLSRFDGSYFKSYSSQNGLSSNDIRAIIEQHSSPGSILVATSDGLLNRITDNAILPIHIPYLDSVDRITSFAQSKSGKIFCGSERGELFSLSDTIPTKIPLKRALTNITQMTALNDSLLYIAGYDGLFAFSLLHNTLVEIAFSDSDNFSLLNVIAVCLDGSGNLWASISGKAIFKIQGTRVVVRKFVSDIGNLFLADDRHGFLWAGSYSGLFKIPIIQFPHDTVMNYKPENGLPDNHIRSGIIDRENNLWLGCDERIFKITNLSFIAFPLAGKEQSGASPYCSRQDSLGHIWFASDSGVIEFYTDDGYEWKTFYHPLNDYPDKNDYNLPRVLTIDHSNNLWILNYINGLECYSIQYHPHLSSKLTLIKRIHQYLDGDKKNIRWIYFDSQERLWIGAKRTGVYVLNPANKPELLSTLTPSTGLPDADIVSICEDHDGTFWFGSKDNGVCYLRSTEIQKKSFHLQYVTQSHSGKDNNYIFDDNNHQLWFGTKTGIVRSFTLPPSSWKSSSVLPQYPIYCMFEDNSHLLWFGTTNGIFYVENTISRTPHWIDQTLGIPIYAIGKEFHGKYWFISDKAIGIFTLDYEQYDAPPILLTHFYCNDVDILKNGDYQLSYVENNCRFQFIGISYHEEKPLQYRYRLLNSYENWSEPTNQTSIGFLSLKPGTYHFEVKAVNYDGMESPVPAKITFTIHSPYWVTWWFICACMILLSTILYVIYRFRLNHLIAMEQMRTHIASDLHDDLASNLSSITMLSELLHNDVLYKMDPEQKSIVINRITDLSNESVEAVRDIIWTIDPRHETTYSLLVRFRDTLLTACQAKKIHLDFTLPNPDKFFAHELSADERKHLWLLLKEASSNSIKHSACTTMTIGVSNDKDILAITIRDNGKGFDTSTKHKGGKGLSTMNMRAEKLFGKMEIVSVPDVGTEIKLRVKTNK